MDPPQDPIPRLHHEHEHHHVTTYGWNIACGMGTFLIAYYWRALQAIGNSPFPLAYSHYIGAACRATGLFSSGLLVDLLGRRKFLLLNSFLLIPSCCLYLLLATQGARMWIEGGVYFLSASLADGLCVGGIVLLVESVAKSRRHVTVGWTLTLGSCSYVLVNSLVFLLIPSAAEAASVPPSTKTLLYGIGTLLVILFLPFVAFLVHEPPIVLKNHKVFGQHESTHTCLLTSSDPLVASSGEMVSSLTQENSSPSSLSSFLKDLGDYFHLQIRTFLFGLFLPVFLLNGTFQGVIGSVGVPRPAIIPWDPPTRQIEVAVSLVVSTVSLLGNILAILLIRRLFPKMLQLLGFVLCAFTFFGLSLTLFSVQASVPDEYLVSQDAKAAVLYDWIFEFFLLLPTVTTLIVSLEAAHTQFRGSVAGTTMTFGVLGQLLQILLRSREKHPRISERATLLIFYSILSILALALTLGATPRSKPNQIELTLLDEIQEQEAQLARADRPRIPPSLILNSLATSRRSSLY